MTLITVGAAAATLGLLGGPMLLMSAGGSTACALGAVPVAGSLSPGQGRVVGASTFGGHDDPGTPGTVGAGGELRGRLAFAELSRNWSASSQWDFAALGGLPMGTRLRVTADGRSVVAVKRDVGRGGPPVGRPPAERRIDLWWQTADALGLPTNWSGLVRVERTSAESSGATGSNDAACTTGIASGSADEIVRIAQRELGTREPEAWSRYGPDPWCALFVSWVWRRAGIAIPTTAFSGAIYTWASEGGGEALPPTARPQPGDAVLYGTGPENSQTSRHLGLVERVFPDGEITTIEGNTAGGVMVARIGPFRPEYATAAPAFRPGAIYGYARPRRTR